MNIYAFHGVLTDYTSGMIIVRASSKKEAVKVLKERFPHEDVCAADAVKLALKGKAMVMEYVCGGPHHVLYVYGGD